MSPKQKKLAAKAPPPNKLDEKDFAVLRAEKAKGRGMGLQDEKVQPGKVMKAKRGDFMERRKKLMGINSVLPSAAKKTGPGGLKKLGRVAGSRAGAIGAILGAGAVGLNMAGRKLKKVLDERKARKRDEAKDTFIDGSKVAASKLSPRMAGGMMKKYSVGGGADMGDPKKPTAIPKGKDSELMVHNTMPSQTGERPLAAPQRRRARKDKQPRQGVKSLRQLKSLRQSAAGPGYLPKPDAPKGKMGGGMMNKPMGYKHGTMVKARGCKLGRTRPTKMY